MKIWANTSVCVCCLKDWMNSPLRFTMMMRNADLLELARCFGGNGIFFPDLVYLSFELNFLYSTSAIMCSLGRACIFLISLIKEQHKPAEYCSYKMDANIFSFQTKIACVYIRSIWLFLYSPVNLSWFFG